MTVLHLHPSVNKEDLRVSLVTAENALHAYRFGMPTHSVDRAAVTMRAIIREMDRQTNDEVHEEADSG